MQSRFGIAEWYGKSFVHLTAGERKEFAEVSRAPKAQALPCLPRQSAGLDVPCTKNSGVCSLRLYQRENDIAATTVAPGELGGIRVTCPYRFRERNLIYEWIGSTLLDCASPVVVGEVGFLQREQSEEADESEKPGREDVGRIDSVLIRPGANPLAWCALEIQAVYFSGPGMGSEFKHIEQEQGPGIPFPTAIRRPDYRSSGPKRLMPQLQIKVPTLRRWGKKMAVLIDEAFFSALGKMDNVAEVSNCDIAWFVVGFDESEGEAHLVKRFHRFTTLERAVEGLTAGRPVSLETFETRIRKKMD